MPQRVYDEQGLIYAFYQRLPGQENNPLYLSIQTQIAQNFPQSMKFGLTRLPVVNELLQVDRFLWRVEGIIHQSVGLEAAPDDLLACLPPQVAIVQLSFYGVLG
ncbi:hypothetical protein ACKFKF_32885 [Phormidesmis sp. 146-12]